MEKKIKVGFVGLGLRGSDILENVVMPFCKEDVEVIAVCDICADRAEKGAEIVVGKGYERPFVTTDYNELLNVEGINAVIVDTAWEGHVEVAVAAMKKGIFTGIEVGGAYSIDDCYKLVRAHEETGAHCMLLENCNYAKRELMILNMVRQGVLGDVMHCDGGYCHDLRSEISSGKEIRHYRLRNYIHRNCDNYPTHEIGPIAKILDINNGNRFVSLVSVASAAKGLNQYAAKTKGADHPLATIDVAQGDVITTVIKCSRGQTITITLDTTLPRFYSRKFSVHGTKGFYQEDTDSIFLDRKEDMDNEWDVKKFWGNAKDYEEEYQHPLWKKDVKTDTHGGIDGIVMSAFFNAVRTNTRPPIDTYDAATYMAVAILSEESIALGGQPVVFPDFTNGKWTMRNDIVDNEYNLDKIDNFKDIYFTNK